MSARRDALDEMSIEHHRLIEDGLLDPDQPTAWAHYTYRRRMRVEFTATERALIRSALGLRVHGGQG